MVAWVQQFLLFQGAALALRLGPIVPLQSLLNSGKAIEKSTLRRQGGLYCNITFQYLHRGSNKRTKLTITALNLIHLSGCAMVAHIQRLQLYGVCCA